MIEMQYAMLRVLQNPNDITIHRRILQKIFESVSANRVFKNYIIKLHNELSIA